MTQRAHLSQVPTRSRQISHQFLQTIFDPNEILNFVRNERGEALTPSFCIKRGNVSTCRDIF